MNTSSNISDIQSQGGVAGTSTPNAGLMAVGDTSTTIGGGGGSGKFNSEHESECSSATSDSIPPGNSDKNPVQNQYIKMILAELQLRRDEFDKLKEKIDRLEVKKKINFHSFL